MLSLKKEEQGRLVWALDTLKGLVDVNGNGGPHGAKARGPLRDSDVARAAGVLESRGVLSIPNSPIRIEYGLGARGNYIEVHDAGGLDWDEGFHRNTPQGGPLTASDVTGWNSNRPEYGVFFAVRYGRNRDLFQFYRLKLQDGHIAVKTGFWDSYSRDDHIELEWGFDRGDSIICKTKPYGRHCDNFRWAYNFDPSTEQWAGFEI